MRARGIVAALALVLGVAADQVPRDAVGAGDDRSRSGAARRRRVVADLTSALEEVAPAR